MVLFMHLIAASECSQTYSRQAAPVSGVGPIVMAVTDLPIKRDVQPLLAPLTPADWLKCKGIHLLPNISFSKC